MKAIFLMLTIFVTTTCQAFDPSNTLIFNTQDFRPFTYQEDGKVSGPATAIVRLACATANIECRFNLLEWPTAIREAKAGKAHGLFVVGWNEERNHWLYYSLPIIRGEYGFFTNTKSADEPKTLTEFQHHNVGVYGPSNLANSLQKIQKAMPSMRISMYEDDKMAFRQLSESKIDSVYSNRDVGYAMIQELGISNLRYSMHQKQLNYYIGFIKEHTPRKLVNRFNRALKEIFRDGRAQDILTHHQLEPIMTRQSFNNRFSLINAVVTPP
ncbi:substrate-binding periplasmic protein [Hahella ganghwensis]|uniref:substrate-binding periplasmic protein n=1 Tax=Hahella ganghwensis TaxID=286420 RepID=UPI000377CE5D|nr:transporter substrate-binding domain-containing protein [Hahella ganghwensis]